LVDEQRAQGAQRVDDQAGFDGAVEAGACEEGKWPFPHESDESENHVEGLDSAIEVFGKEIPEDFGPEEGFERGCYLI
jgi:hypothetical protein